MIHYTMYVQHGLIQGEGISSFQKSGRERLCLLGIKTGFCSTLCLRNVSASVPDLYNLYIVLDFGSMDPYIENTDPVWDRDSQI